MQTPLSGGLEPTKYNGRAKDARPSYGTASRWRVVLDTLYVKNPEPFSLASQRLAQQTNDAPLPTEATYFQAYPNPFSQELSITYNLGNDCSSGCYLRIIDVQGRIILDKALVANEGKGSLSLNMSQYENGIYFCALYSNTRLLQTEKLILLR